MNRALKCVHLKTQILHEQNYKKREEKDRMEDMKSIVSEIIS